MPVGALTSVAGGHAAKGPLQRVKGCVGQAHGLLHDGRLGGIHALWRDAAQAD